MNCPACPSTELRLADRSGVEIDYCPSCRGVWLDRGELEKIIDRSASWRSEHDDDNDYERRFEHKPNRKRKSLLGEFFDF